MPEGRPFWSGTITFGLVSVPVNLFAAYRSGGSSLRMVAEDGVPLERRYYCPAHEREIGRDEITRGYEVEDGRYVVVQDEELESLQPEKSKEIDLQRFVDRTALDPVLFERAYFLTPAGDVTKPYRLLARVMEETGRAGIARFVMRGREYLVAILADRGILRAETMRFHDELRGVEDVGLALEEDGTHADLAPEIAAVRDSIERRAADELDPEELRDSGDDRLERLVADKLASGENVVAVEDVEGEGADDEEPRSGEEDEDRGSPSGVIDIMEVIRRNLARDERDSREGSGGRAGVDGELEDETKEGLYKRARKLDVSGRSKMNKQELIEAIRDRAG